jgi:hypothetical protein
MIMRLIGSLSDNISDGDFAIREALLADNPQQVNGLRRFYRVPLFRLAQKRSALCVGQLPQCGEEHGVRASAVTSGLLGVGDEFVQGRW